ncbi:MAG: hypothetical protein NWR36_01135, partial [Opitutales bacterium]|nr:hypothetical protein [Opitutales bacterium]
CHNEKPIEAQEGEYRFTRSKDGQTVYAFILKWPGAKQIHIQSFAGEGSIQSVELIGQSTLPFTQDEQGLKVQLPADASNAHASVLKLKF